MFGKMLQQPWTAGWVLMSLANVITAQTCGGNMKVEASDTGSISSQNYPKTYRNQRNCVWLLRAPVGKSVSLTVTGGVAGQTSNTSCIDYLEIRNGSSLETLLYYECDNTETATVYARYLWVRFKSNYAEVNKGFTATWEVISDPASIDVSPSYVECPMEYKCANKECIPWAYVCDGYNDCGCDDKNCDEYDCGAIGVTVQDKLAIGIGVGAGFFVICFFGIGLLDIWLKKRTERKYQERMELQKKLQKQKKAKAMASLFVTQPSFVGSNSGSGGSVANAKGALKIPSVSVDSSASSGNKK